MQKVFSNIGYQKGNFPISENISKNIINLPIGSHLKTKDVELVVDNLLKVI